jgi:hypothetical protein
VCAPGTGKPFGRIAAVDVAAHMIDIEHSGRYADFKPERLFVRPALLFRRS